MGLVINCYSDWKILKHFREYENNGIENTHTQSFKMHVHNIKSNCQKVELTLMSCNCNEDRKFSNEKGRLTISIMTEPM